MMNAKARRIFAALIAILVLVTACLSNRATTVPASTPERIPTTSAPAAPPVDQTPTSAAPGADQPARTVVAAQAAEADLLRGIAILGDSNYDEYQADDWRGGSYHDVTLNLVEILVRQRGFNVGGWGTWGEPRRSGYEYNWARSGATSQDMIATGQHTGAAEQIRAGKVTFVFIGIGSNDFSPFYGDNYANIYNDVLSDAELEAKIQNAVDNITLAVDTVQEAGAKGVLIIPFSLWEQAPGVLAKFPDAARRQRVTDAIKKVNEGIQAMAQERGAVVVDQNAIYQQLAHRLEESRYVMVGGQQVDFLTGSDEPYHVLLGDQLHLSTITNGLLANVYFIEPLNTHFHTQIPPLTDDEVLQLIERP